MLRKTLYGLVFAAAAGTIMFGVSQAGPSPNASPKGQAAAAAGAGNANPAAPGQKSRSTLALGFLGRYNSGLFDQAGAEIPAYCPATKRLFVVNAGPGTVDVLDLTVPATPVKLLSIDCGPFGGAGLGGSPNSVAVHDGLLAIAVQNNVKTSPGEVVFFNTNDATFTVPLNTVTAGALPDMLCFTPDGTRVLVANEGEPNDDYTTDPEGSVSIIDISGGVTVATVKTASFAAFNPQKAALKAAGVRIFGPGSDVDGLATVAQDLEPEYITVSEDSSTAWVTLQENNAIGILKISTATFTRIVPLGFKDHSLERNSLDPSDTGAVVAFKTGRVKGMYQPDAIASYTVKNKTYLVTANEGDVREYLGTPGFVEVARIGSSAFVLDPVKYPDATFKQNANFGRLNATRTLGDTDNDGDYDDLYVFGARSFSIWDEDAKLVWDSGNELEKLTFATNPRNFNASNTNNTLDNRSDDKGPEPEAVAVAEISGRHFVFVGLERVGGIVVYDVTDPRSPVFQTYVNTRDFNQTPGPAAGPGQPVPGLDLGPEGIIFISAADSPTGEALLVVCNEISGSTSVFKVSLLFE